MGLVLAGALVLVLAGMGMGYKWAWMDAYHKGRADALAPFKPHPWPK